MRITADTAVYALTGIGGTSLIDQLVCGGDFSVFENTEHDLHNLTEFVGDFIGGPNGCFYLSEEDAQKALDDMLDGEDSMYARGYSYSVEKFTPRAAIDRIMQTAEEHKEHKRRLME